MDTETPPADAPVRSVFATQPPTPPPPASPMLPPATGETFMPLRLDSNPRWFRSKMPSAFWRAATLFSFIVNGVLLVVVLAAGLLIFQIKRSIAQPLIGGLYTSFVQMDAASIVATVHVDDTITVNDTIYVNDTITVNDTLPVIFNLPLDTNTQVVLTDDTPIPNTTVMLNGLAVPTDIVLPAGTPLNIHLVLVVPVSQTVPVVLHVPIQLEVPINLEVPVSLEVPVNIPLRDTDLHQPFTNLANLLAPYNALLELTPSSWGEVFFGQ